MARTLRSGRRGRSFKSSHPEIGNRLGISSIHTFSTHVIQGDRGLSTVYGDIRRAKILKHICQSLEYVIVNV